MSLTNAYYLGELLSNMDSMKDRLRYKQKLTKHYSTIAEYTYDLFELNPKQMMHIRQTTIQDIRKLKCSQVLELRNLIFFVRA